MVLEGVMSGKDLLQRGHMYMNRCVRETWLPNVWMDSRFGNAKSLSASAIQGTGYVLFSGRRCNTWNTN